MILRRRSSFRGLQGRWHFQESGFHREVKKSSVQFSMELAFQRVVEKLKEGEQWVAGAKENSARVEDKMGEKRIVPEAFNL